MIPVPERIDSNFRMKYANCKEKCIMLFEFVTATLLRVNIYIVISIADVPMAKNVPPDICFTDR